MQTAAWPLISSLSGLFFENTVEENRANNKDSVLADINTNKGLATQH